MQNVIEAPSCSTPVCLSSASSSSVSSPPLLLRHTSTPPPAHPDLGVGWSGLEGQSSSDHGHGTAAATGPPVFSPPPSSSLLVPPRSQPFSTPTLVSRSSSSVTTTPSLETTARELRDVQAFLRGNAFDVGGPYADLFMVLLSTVRTLVDASVLTTTATVNPPPSILSPSSSLSSQRANTLPIAPVAPVSPLPLPTGTASPQEMHTATMESRLSQVEEALRRLQHENTLVMKALDRVLRMQLEERKKKTDLLTSTSTSIPSTSSPPPSVSLSTKILRKDWMALKSAIDDATTRYCQAEYAAGRSDVRERTPSSNDSGNEELMKKIAESLISLVQTIAPNTHSDGGLVKASNSRGTLSRTREEREEEKTERRKKVNHSVSLSSSPRLPSDGVKVFQKDDVSLTSDSAPIVAQNNSDDSSSLQSLICRLEVLEAYTPFSLPRMRARLPFLGFEVNTNGDQYRAKGAMRATSGEPATGIRVHHVYPGYAAAHQDLRPGDVLLSLNDIALCPPSNASASGSQAVGNGAGQLYLVLEEVLREDRALRMATLQRASSSSASPSPLCTAVEGGGEGAGMSAMLHRSSRAAQSHYLRSTPHPAEPKGDQADAGIGALLHRAFNAPCVLRFLVQSVSRGSEEEKPHQSLWTMQLEVPNPPRG